MLRVCLSLLVLGIGFVFASEASFEQSDFIERTINFVIFLVIIWYLGSEKIKQIFLARRQEISSKFSSLQDKEKEIKKEKEEAERMLIDARNRATEIISIAKKECFSIEQQFSNRLENDIKSMGNNFDNLLLQEKRKMLCLEIHNALEGISKDVTIESNSYLKILSNGVKNG